MNLRIFISSVQKEFAEEDLREAENSQGIQFLGKRRRNPVGAQVG